ncbi:protoporphyrinogen oxidase HemJ [Anabaena subtropica]|uniref:Protoporphyrinogen IX oxidase n=1 Tax=Anabaena subtropica FACHB-260 TaxID=2692884 RepID=A0ABR8CQ23_9NOST|nr:protoporphyrinogen oxidase HemJ [Anabaena subtropica]MBD2345295.1 protoporphyrinogen oxidase HemJ [Anabaena subtropica FACHB-260]
MAYLWFKSFHILGFVAWFAGLFYLPRLFIYHIEAEERQEPVKTALKQEYSRIEKLLYKLIMMPAMIFTIAMAIGIISTQPDILKQDWLHVKLFLVFLLICFHFYCGRFIRQLETDTYSINSLQMRRINEIPTILLALVVLLAIFKNSLPTTVTALGTAIAIFIFAVVIQLYARKRRLQNQGELSISLDEKANIA